MSDTNTNCDVLTRKFVEVADKYKKDLEAYTKKKDEYTRWSKKEKEFAKYKYAGEDEDIKVFQMKGAANDSEKHNACSMCSDGKSNGELTAKYNFWKGDLLRPGGGDSLGAYCNPGKKVALNPGKYKNIGNQEGVNWGGDGNGSIWYKCGKDKDIKDAEKRAYRDANPFGADQKPPGEPKLILPELNLVCCNQIIKDIKGKVKIDKLVQDCDQSVSKTKGNSDIQKNPEDSSGDDDQDYETKKRNQQYLYFFIIALVIMFLCSSSILIGFLLSQKSGNSVNSYDMSGYTY